MRDVVATYVPALYRRARSLTRDRWDAWDLVQDTFERALKRAPTHLPVDKIEPWLLVILRNLFVDRHRRSQRALQVPLSDELLPYNESEVDSQPPVWRVVDDQLLRGCVAELDERLRDVYLSYSERRLTLAEISELLGIPVATAGTRLFRARRRLRALVKRRIRTVAETRTSSSDAERML